MPLKTERLLRGLAAILYLAVCAAASAQTATAAGATAPQASNPAPSPAPAAPSPTWSVGGIDFSGFVDGYYSYNANRPSNAANGQINDLYNFDDKTDQFSLQAAKLTLNHDPDPIGVHADLIFGRANVLVHPATEKDTDNYIEQAYLSLKPARWHGSELDLGQFVTSAGAEVIESKDNWNYSRSLLFAWAIPFYHFGLRSSMPVTKTWTAGLQVVNGWNNVVANNGGVTIGLTSAYVKPRYTWNLNYYTGPSNTDTQKGYRNLIDSTLLLTPTTKFSAYINFDYGQNKIPSATMDVNGVSVLVPSDSPHWEGIALAAHEQLNVHSSFTGRYEYFTDNQGFMTGAGQNLQEVTATYEYKWIQGLLTRVEYRHDWSSVNFFHKGDTDKVDAQSTLTVGLIAFFGPKR